ncbi:MAG: LemA family protein [Verrucomicrobia bacterium]|nr:LemA family protein [Verrucomicrobiota bacterium]MCH8511510.1 LemA family protein [Kiritimatiellia bacterium]
MQTHPNVRVSSSVLPETIWTANLLGFFVALMILCFGFYKRRKKHLIDDLPTSKVDGVFIGLVELKGTAEAERPLTSYLKACRCVQYEWKVEEHWRKTETVYYRDKDGKRRSRTRTRSGWRTVGQDARMIPFYLKDDTGVILVLPRGAKIEPAMVFSRQCRKGDPLYYGKGPRRGVPNSTGRRRFTEQAIPLHHPLYLVGKARERDDVVAPVIAANPEARLFLISTRSEDQVSVGFAAAYVLSSIFGGVIILLAQFFIWHEHPQAGEMFVRYGWPWWLGYVFAWIVGWFVVTFNSLVCVRQRMLRAWSTVDVQLKRRATLIPRLVEILQGLKTHERAVHEAVAHLRSQAEATEPGKSGPDPVGCRAQLRMVVEACPELKSDRAFSKFQNELSHTEERIALARSYFNEVCTFYNTRLEVWPDSLLAKMGGFQIHPLIRAENFERAAVKIDLAD